MRKQFPKYKQADPVLIAPSILAADFTKLGAAIESVSCACDLIHVDVMDGNFVPNISFGQPVLESIQHVTDLPFDVHLMIEKPERYIESFAKAGASGLTIHVEACTHLHRACQEIRAAGLSVGVTINPSTPLAVLEEILPYTDLVLLMSVNPGFGGQSYIPETTEKIRRLRQMINDRGLSVHIQVDGGISTENIAMCWEAGANIFVAGSSIFKSQNPADEIREMKRKCAR